MASPKAILVYSLLTTYLTIINGWRPVGEWNHLYASVHRRSAEVMWKLRHIVNVRGRRIWISAFFLGKYGQYEIWLMLNCSKLEESMISIMQPSFYKQQGKRHQLHLSGPHKFREPRVFHSWNERNIVVLHRTWKMVEKARWPDYICRLPH